MADYLSAREEEEKTKGLDLSALTKKTPKPGALEPAVLKAAENRGFGRDVVVVKPGGEPPSETTASGDGENQVQAKPKPSKPRLAVEQPKPARRRQISRRPRNSGQDTGQLTLTGDAETLDALTFHAIYQRVPYVAMLGQMLELWENTHGHLPAEFVAEQKDKSQSKD